MDRREFIAGSAVGVTLLAGCSGQSSTETPDGNESGDSSTGTSAEYSVTMEPVGELTFDSVPQSVAHYFPGYADMQVALGHGDGIDAIGVRSRYHTDHYADLDGVSVDKESMTELVGKNGIDKEIFYELGSDLHLIDPRWLTNNGFFGLEKKDIDELSTNAAPFFGNSIFRRTDGWHDYRYYTMYEAFEKVAAVFQEEERFTKLKEFHDSLLADVEEKLPPAEKRPNALLVFAAGDNPEKFSPYRVSDKGTNKKQFHDLGIGDALEGTGIEGLSTTDRGQIDYEAMLDVDPDSILVRGHENKSEQEFRDTVLNFMKNHDTASKLTAVQNGDVFRGGPIYAGPLHNLSLTERFAKNFFPDAFSGELFSRSDLAAIVTDGN